MNIEASLGDFGKQMKEHQEIPRQIYVANEEATDSVTQKPVAKFSGRPKLNSN